MSARLQRTLYTLGAGVLALLVAVGILWLVPDMDPRIRDAVVGVALAAAYAIKTFLTESNPDIAAPTVTSVNATLRSTLANPLVRVAPPSEQVPEPPIIMSAPDVP